MKFPTKNSKAAKLTAGQVMQIRELYANTAVTQGQLSRDFGVSGIQIGRILRGESWQQLPVVPTKEEIEMSGRRMAELANQVRNESSTDRMAREIFEKKKMLPDNMIDELSGIPEGDI